MANSIPALVPRGRGHQFVVYGDSCSGVFGGPHERTFACVNAVVRRLQPQPEFILFLGDEIVGLTADARALRAQWSHWLDVEMAWLDRGMTPVWHTTSNHTTYDVMSEAVFREVLRLPENGPPQQVGLSYFVRRSDLLLVFVHTSWSGLGGALGGGLLYGPKSQCGLRYQLLGRCPARNDRPIGSASGFANGRR